MKLPSSKVQQIFDYCVTLYLLNVNPNWVNKYQPRLIYLFSKNLSYTLYQKLTRVEFYIELGSVGYVYNVTRMFELW